MKRKVTKEDLVLALNDLDHRTESWDEKKIDRCINNGFAELCTVQNFFATDVSVELDDYYDSGETKFIVNLDDDSLSIYDLYLVEVTTDKGELHGEIKHRSENLIWRDTKDVDIAHVNLNGLNCNNVYSTAVVKYFYVPTSDFKDMYISNNVYLALNNALAATMYDMMNDVERSGQKRAAMERTGQSIPEYLPEDYLNLPTKPSMFPTGV